ncbi:MAG: hypothetical protein LUC93_14710 [Planctomycetaceae bacterium]|nr:hypothetical protein [Planctomycetaceae bacterium]
MSATTKTAKNPERGVAAYDSDDLKPLYMDLIARTGLSGKKIAQLSGTRPQYISDIKRNQRPLSEEMFRRTLVGLFGNYGWLMTGDIAADARHIVPLYPFLANANSPLAPLPVLRMPFWGPNLGVNEWDGFYICVASPLKELVASLIRPYVLDLPFDDQLGRLRRGDYLIIDQRDRRDAAYVLLKSGWGVKLARRVENGFVDAETGDRQLNRASEIIGSVAKLLMGDVSLRHEKGENSVPPTDTA